MKSDLKIGVVLAGGMNKGAYAIGCMKAIRDYFGTEQIACLSASSIGVLIGHSFFTNQLDELARLWESVNVEKTGKFFPALLSKPVIRDEIKRMIVGREVYPAPFYGTLWNFFRRRAEYTNLKKLEREQVYSCILASMSMPVFSKGVRLGEELYFDGAVLDNIPVHPLLGKELDVIFCIYFDPQYYLFENTQFDDRVVKLNDFPTNYLLRDHLKFDPHKVEPMVCYGYEYARGVIERLFEGNEIEAVYRAIREERLHRIPEKRLTADTLFTNLNKMTARFSKREIR